MDDAVGTLTTALDRPGHTENTILIFTSDHGGNMYGRVGDVPPTSNRPLRGGKATIFEGGTRVPCGIAWPGKTAPDSRSDAIIQSEDFHPTLVKALGIETGQPFDGIDITPALAGRPLERDAVFQYFPHDPPIVPDWLPPALAGLPAMASVPPVMLVPAAGGEAHQSAAMPCFSQAIRC